MATKSSQNTALIDALAFGLSYQSAADRVGIGKTTVRRRMSDPEFRAKVTERRGNILEESTGRLTGATKAAVSTLKKLLKSDSDAVRLGAAREIISATMALKQFTELEQRIANLERVKADESN